MGLLFWSVKYIIISEKYFFTNKCSLFCRIFKFIKCPNAMLLGKLYTISLDFPWNILPFIIFKWIYILVEITKSQILGDSVNCWSTITASNPSISLNVSLRVKSILYPCFKKILHLAEP